MKFKIGVTVRVCIPYSTSTYCSVTLERLRGNLLSLFDYCSNIGSNEQQRLNSLCYLYFHLTGVALFFNNLSFGCKFQLCEQLSHFCCIESGLVYCCNGNYFSVCECVNCKQPNLLPPIEYSVVEVALNCMLSITTHKLVYFPIALLTICTRSSLCIALWLLLMLCLRIAFYPDDNINKHWGF